MIAKLIVLLGAAYANDLQTKYLDATAKASFLGTELESELTKSFFVWTDKINLQMKQMLAPLSQGFRSGDDVQVATELQNYLNCETCS